MVEVKISRSMYLAWSVHKLFNRYINGITITQCFPLCSIKLWMPFFRTSTGKIACIEESNFSHIVSTHLTHLSPICSYLLMPWSAEHQSTTCKGYIQGRWEKGPGILYEGNFKGKILSWTIWDSAPFLNAIQEWNSTIPALSCILNINNQSHKNKKAMLSQQGGLFWHRFFDYSRQSC